MRPIKLDEYVDFRKQGCTCCIVSWSGTLLQGYAPFWLLWDFSDIFAPNFVNFDPWFGIRKEVTTYFTVFPRRVLRIYYAPLKFSKRKNKFVMATTPKPFNEIP